VSAFGFLLHQERPEAVELGKMLASWLVDRGHEVRLLSTDALRIGRPELGVDPDEFAVGLDLVVGLGGDGTILRAVELCSDEGVVVLGVNLGQLGYLATVEPTQAKAAIKRFLAGAYHVEERMRLAVHIRRADGTVHVVRSALNEAIVERSDLGHTVRIEVALDGEPFTPYVADGVIIATPTGSTAYAMSARGPIVDPRYLAQVLVPVSPHMLFDRALVLDPTTLVSLRCGGHRPAHLSVDGRSEGLLEPGDAIECTASDVPAQLLDVGGAGFHQVLKSKFGLHDRV
jgi:NAD+ kinase